MSIAAKCICGYAFGYCNMGIEQCRNRIPEFDKSKPLSELSQSVSDCEKILKFVFPGANLSARSGRDDFMLIHGDIGGNCIDIEISFGGSISLIQTSMRGQCNHFALVDFIRSLGYDVK